MIILNNFWFLVCQQPLIAKRFKHGTSVSPVYDIDTEGQTIVQASTHATRGWAFEYIGCCYFYCMYNKYNFCTGNNYYPTVQQYDCCTVHCANRSSTLQLYSSTNTPATATSILQLLLPYCQHTGTTVPLLSQRFSNITPTRPLTSTTTVLPLPATATSSRTAGATAAGVITPTTPATSITLPLLLLLMLRLSRG